MLGLLADTLTRQGSHTGEITCHEKRTSHLLSTESHQFWAVNAKRVGENAQKHRLPVMSEDLGIVEAGDLIQYGVDITDLWRRAAGYVDKILKGSKPADLPGEQPKTFEMIIDLKTAKSLGLTISPSPLIRRTM
jgi:ABC-type uncharacterized transport system substrate-binding protein